MFSGDFPSGIGSGKAGDRLETLVAVERRSVAVVGRESLSSMLELENNVIPKRKQLWEKFYTLV
jgi:hypothetical protein